MSRVENEISYYWLRVKSCWSITRRRKKVETNFKITSLDKFCNFFKIFSMFISTKCGIRFCVKNFSTLFNKNFHREEKKKTLSKQLRLVVVEISFMENQMKKLGTENSTISFRSMKHTSEVHKYDEFMCINVWSHHQGKKTKKRNERYKQTNKQIDKHTGERKGSEITSQAFKQMSALRSRRTRIIFVS